jgi:hypothetical protein
VISFSVGKLREKTCFGPIRNLFSFSTAQTEKNLWTKLGKLIGGKSDELNMYQCHRTVCKKSGHPA